jgi:hypothetical protein
VVLPVPPFWFAIEKILAAIKLNPNSKILIKTMPIEHFFRLTYKSIESHYTGALLGTVENS